MKNKKIGLIFNGVWSHYAFAKATKYAPLYELLYVHDLHEDMFSGVDAIVIPFQSNHKAIALHKDELYRFLESGKKIFIEGDSSAHWLQAVWEDRPVNNYWWVTDPGNPPVSETDYSHPLYSGLQPRHAFWHYHGVYTSVPPQARIIQRKVDGAVVTWETNQYGGALLVTTLDPIVEHGVQQIRHLNNYCDKLTEWLIDVKPHGEFIILEKDYGIEL